MKTCTLLPLGAGDGIDVTIQPFPAPGFSSGVGWGRVAANGERYGIDRGLDTYTADVVFDGQEAAMQALGEWLEANGRGGFRLSGIDGYIFPPHIDQSGDVIVAPVARDKEQRIFLSTHAVGVNELSMTLRAVSPSFLGSPSLAGLRVSEKYTADKSTTTEISFTEAGASVVVDMDADAGMFRAEFEQGHTATMNALAYLTLSARETAFPFPSIGVSFPFGKARGGLPKNCKCTGLSAKRSGLAYWILDLTLSESFE